MSDKSKSQPQNSSTLVGLFILIGTILIVWHVLGRSGSNNLARSASKATYQATLADNCPMTIDSSCWGPQGSVEVINPADLRVFVRAVNNSTVSGTPSCTIEAEDAGYNYHGVDVVTRTSALDPGGIWNFDDDLTITSQGAQYVTKVSINCQNT